MWISVFACIDLGGSDAAAAKGKVAAPQLVLLLDPMITELPWEGLILISELFQGNVCRDFSIHMLGHRCSALVPAPPAGGAAPAKGGGGSNVGLDVNGNVVVSASGTKVLVDPFEDDIGNSSKGFERPAIHNVFSKLQTTIPGATKWTPVNSSKSTISVQDWIGVTAASVSATPAGKGAPAGDAAGPGKLYSVVSYIPGKITNYLPICDFASMNFEQVAVFVVSDQGHSSNSILRQNALDNLKAKKEIALETPLRVAALASLAGVGAVLMPIWGTSLASQARFIDSFWNSFTKQQQNLCASLAASKVLPNNNPAAAGSGEDASNHHAHNAHHAAVPAAGAAHGHKGAHGHHGDSAMTASTKVKASATPPVMKNWVKHARLLFGVPSIAYTDV